MIGINKTNILGRQNNYNLKDQDKYLGIWSDAEESKKKRSEVSLVMSKK